MIGSIAVRSLQKKMARHKQDAGYELVNKKAPQVAVSPLHDGDPEAPEEIVVVPEKIPSPWWKIARLVIPPNWQGKLRFVVCLIFLISSKVAMLASPMALSIGKNIGFCSFVLCFSFQNVQKYKICTKLIRYIFTRCFF
jgi:hypothetical protein